MPMHPPIHGILGADADASVKFRSSCICGRWIGATLLKIKIRVFFLISSLFFNYYYPSGERAHPAEPLLKHTAGQATLDEGRKDFYKAFVPGFRGFPCSNARSREFLRKSVEDDESGISSAPSESDCYLVGEKQVSLSVRESGNYD